jgi:cell division protein FtsQ
MFTNFPSDKKILQKADSNLLREIHIISNALQADSFSMAMIDQVDITPERSFEMIPKFGNTTIVFGDASAAGEKLSKLRLFYREVVVKAGWSKYSEINVRYSNQVVCKRKGVAEVKADSLRTLQLMKVIAENAERMASDTLLSILPDNESNTTNHNIIQQSLERDDDKSTNTNEEPKPQGRDSSETPTPPIPGKDTKAGAQRVNAAKEIPAGKKPALVKPAEVKAASIAKPNEKTTKKPKLLMPEPVPKGQAPPKPANEY